MSVVPPPGGEAGGDHTAGVRRHIHAHLDRRLKVVRLSELLSAVRLPPNAEACPSVSHRNTHIHKLSMMSQILLIGPVSSKTTSDCLYIILQGKLQNSEHNSTVICVVSRTTCQRFVWRRRTERWCLLPSKMTVWIGSTNCAPAHFR